MISASHVRRVEYNWVRDLLLRHLEGKLICRKKGEREREKEKRIKFRETETEEKMCMPLL